MGVPGKHAGTTAESSACPTRVLVSPLIRGVSPGQLGWDKAGGAGAPSTAGKRPIDKRSQATREATGSEPSATWQPAASVLVPRAQTNKMPRIARAQVQLQKW